MYGKSNKIITAIEELSNYIYDYDIYNSKILDVLQTPGIEREDYEITVYQYRPDLIAEDVYGSRNYLGLLMLQTGLTLANFTRGTIIKIIPKSKLDNLLRSI